MSSAVAKEFKKVPLGEAEPVNDDDWSSASDFESSASEHSDSEDLEADAIKWAMYRDSRKDRPVDGLVGWHYQLMWKGYLKSYYDTEEFMTSFVPDENGKNKMLMEFWEAVGRPMTQDETGEWIEPKGARGDYVEPPKWLVKRWMKEARPRRNYNLYRVRLAKEKAKPSQPIQRRDSDHYWLKRIKLKKANEGKVGADGKLLQPQPSEGEGGPSTQASRAGSQNLNTSAPSSQGGPSGTTIKLKIPSKGKGKAKNPELASSLFPEDEIVITPDTPDKQKKKKKKKKKNRDTGEEGGQNVQSDVVVDSDKAGKGKGKQKENGLNKDKGSSSHKKNDKGSTVGVPIGGDKDKKRKHGSTSGGTLSPEKKRKSTSPVKAHTFVPPTPKIIPPTPASVRPGASTSTGQPNGASTSNTRPRDTVSPTPSTSGPGTTRRPGQEPLFLDSAPSPADTFGEPLPGIFDARPSSARTPVVKKEVESIDISSPASVVAGVDTSQDNDSSDIIMLDPSSTAKSVEGLARRSRTRSPLPVAVPSLVAEANAPQNTIGAIAHTNQISRSKSKSPLPTTAPAATASKEKESNSPKATTPPTLPAAPPDHGHAQGTKSRSKSPIPTPIPLATPTLVDAASSTRIPSATEATAPIGHDADTGVQRSLNLQPVPSRIEPKEGSNASTSVPSASMGDDVKAPATTPQAAKSADSNNASPAVPPALTPPGAEAKSTSPAPIATSLASTTQPAAISVAPTPIGPPAAAVAKESTETIQPSVTPAAPPPNTSIPSPHSPIIEPPAPTFTSPRQVSRSPSEPMEIDAEDTSPIVPAVELPLTESGNLGLGISPPRYVDELPAKEPTSPTAKAAPVKPFIPPSERPKYIQPSRIQYIADVVDPEAEAMRSKMAARKGASHAALPTRPTAKPSTSTTSHVRPPVPMLAPTQPKGFGAAPPTGPSGAGYASRGTGPLADQKEAYKGVKPPWQARKQARGPGGSGYGGVSPANPYGGGISPAHTYGGGVSPANPYGGQSPHHGPPAGPSAMRTDQWRPNTPVYAGIGGQSPAWAPNISASASLTQPMAGAPGWVQPGGQSPYPPVAVDPRGSASGMSPNPTLGHQHRPQAVDPRRVSSDQSGMGQSPLRPPTSPGGGSGSVGPRRVNTIGRVSATLLPPNVDGEVSQFNLTIMDGAPQGLNPVGDKVLSIVLGPMTKSSGTIMPMDEVDMSLIGWQMRYGARLVQWAKVGCIPSKSTNSQDWERLKRRAQDRHRAWTTFTECPAEGNNTVTEHFAIILAHITAVEGAVRSFGLGSWPVPSEIGMTLLVLALPLDSGPSPMLPNPAQPILDVKDEKPTTVKTGYPMHILASYDLTPDFFHALRGTRAIRYPGQETHYDILGTFIEHEFTDKGVIPHNEQIPPENVLFMNSKYTRAIKSTTLARTVDRRTKYYAVGPALHLLPSQWALREIWATGGLVTFSPTFVLRSPGKLAEIMKMIRVAPNWAAYVTPQLVQWVHASWKLPARCPDPSAAYQTFTQSLFFDNHLLSLSGSPAAAGGGLAVSTCPPLLSHGERCARWMEWLQRISTERDYHTLVNLCHNYAAFLSGKKSIRVDVDANAPPQEVALELVDIERKQIEDLTAMRKRPHLVPYRRYIYIGEVSMTKEQRDKIGAGVEFVEPDRFAAMFSGAQ